MGIVRCEIEGFDFAVVGFERAKGVKGPGVVEVDKVCMGCGEEVASGGEAALVICKDW